MTPTDAMVADARTTSPADLCPEGACNPISNEGCSRDGCRFLSLDGVSPPQAICIDTGPRTEGQGCLTYDDCEAGLFCSPLTFVCVRYCCGGAQEACSPGTACLDLFDGVGYCEPDARCGLLDAAGCGEGDGCFVVAANGSTLCLPRSGDRGEDDACEGLECGVGLNCFDGTCTRFCRVGNEAGCDVGKRCIDQEYEDLPGIGTCEDVDDPCAGSPNSGACTNPADCAIYDGDPLSAVGSALSCSSNPDPTACVQEATGLSRSCSACFTNLSASGRGVFLTCAGF